MQCAPKRGGVGVPSQWYPHNRLAKALYVLYFLICNETGKTACERQYSFNTRAHLKLPVMVKDLSDWRMEGTTPDMGKQLCLCLHRPSWKWIPSRCVWPFVTLYWSCICSCYVISLCYSFCEVVIVIVVIVINVLGIVFPRRFSLFNKK